MSKTKKIGSLTAISIVVANMIGTGAFTSLGFQLQDLKNYKVILLVWVLGGIIALSGAFSYAEIGTRIQKSGGEYTFLSKTISPSIGFLAGWVSLTVGFSAPIALSAIAVIEYFPFWELNPVLGSIILVAIITLIHSVNINTSSKFQMISTLLKIALIIVIIIIGVVKSPETQNLIYANNYKSEFLSGAFAIALIYVSYSYSGWNAVVYITEEIKTPKSTIPKSLIGGTLFVTVLYTLLQFIFLKHVPVSELVGQINVGAIATQNMLGIEASNIFSLSISLLLISGISAMVWIGPRVTSTMAKDFKILDRFKANRDSIPVKALWLQFLITVFLLVTGTFEQILIYCGFLLTLSSLLTVIGSLRFRNTHAENQSFKSPLFPLFQLLFIVFSLYMLCFIFITQPRETIMGLVNLVLGSVIWVFNKKYKSK